jgi:hypothetical protein
MVCAIRVVSRLLPIADEGSSDDCTGGIFDRLISRDVGLAENSRVSVIRLSIIELCNGGVICVQGGSNCSRPVFLLFAAYRATFWLKVKSMTRSPTTSVPGHSPLGVGVVVALALFAMFPAQADVRIVSSPGGAVDAYLAAFARVRQSGERVVIDGPCLSACTLVLSTIPRNRICVTRRAVLGFHAPKYVDPRSGRMSRSPEATRIVTQSYPAGVRAWIKKRGGLTGKLIYLRGRELGSLYRRC